MADDKKCNLLPEDLVKEFLGDNYCVEAKGSLEYAIEDAEKLGLDRNPCNISFEDMARMYEPYIEADLDQIDPLGYLGVFGNYLDYYGNKAAIGVRRSLMLGWPSKAQYDEECWFTAEVCILNERQCMELIRSSEDPLQEMVSHLQLLMGLDIQECANITLGDIH